MSQKRIQQIEQRIDRIKKALLEIGPMRPGSLSRQYKDPQHQTGAYWQISYTRRMKSRTEYVRREWVMSVAAKKGTKMAAKWCPTRRAVRSEPFPLLRTVVKNGPEPSRARRCWARRSEPLTARTVLR